MTLISKIRGYIKCGDIPYDEKYGTDAIYFEFEACLISISRTKPYAMTA